MAVPSGNAGAMAGAKSQIRNAYSVFVKALESFPVGSDDHKAILQIMQSINKIAPASAEVPGVQQVSAAGQMANAQKNALMEMLNRQSSQGGTSAGGGAAGSPMPPSPAMPPSLAAAA